MTYRIKSYDFSGFTVDYGGGYSEQDIKSMTKGYKLDKDLTNENADIYSRKNGLLIYIVTKE